MPRAKKTQELAKEDFEKLQQYVTTTTQMRAKLGAIEVSKMGVIGQIGQLDAQYDKFKEGLEHKYCAGMVIDLETGTYKTPEQVAEEAEKAQKDAANKKN